MPSREEFVRQYYPYAKRWEGQTGIPAAVFLAIGASETNWGAAGSLFGIKGASSSGKSAVYDTWEQTANGPVATSDRFAVYDSPDEGAQHFLSLIQSGRYAGAWRNFQKNGDWRQLLAGINAAGYATDPIWHQKIGSIAGQVDSIVQQQGGGGAAMPGGSTVDPVIQQEFQRAQEQYSALSQRTVYLQSQLARTDLSEADRTRYRVEQDNLTAGGGLKAARDEMLAFWSILNPGRSESPSARINAEANWVKAQYDIAQGLYSNQLNYGQLALNIIKANNDVADAAFDRWYKGQQISQGDLNLLMTARAKQQAEQLALLSLRLEQAEFISKQQAWNAVHLFQQADAGQKLYQPGFGPNDAMAQAGRLVGLNAPVIEARPVNEADFDPVNILRRSGEALPAGHDDDWWGATAAQARYNNGVAGAPVGGTAQIDPAAILPPKPTQPPGITPPGDTGDGDDPLPPATVGASVGKALRGSLESLIGAVQGASAAARSPAAFQQLEADIATQRTSQIPAIGGAVGRLTQQVGATAAQRGWVWDQRTKTWTYTGPADGPYAPKPATAPYGMEDSWLYS